MTSGGEKRGHELEQFVFFPNRNILPTRWLPDLTCPLDSYKRLAALVFNDAPPPALSFAARLTPRHRLGINIGRRPHVFSKWGEPILQAGG